MVTIGFLELSSIAKGIEAADAMLKAADVQLISAHTSCPGKYHVLISGEVSAVQSAVDSGASVAGDNLIEKLVIARVHPQVVEAINLCTPPVEANAVGILEYFSVTASILGADAASKAADIHLLEIRLGTGIGGKSFVVLTGEVAAVTEAVHCGASVAMENGMLVSKVVIPHPHPDIFKNLL